MNKKQRNRKLIHKNKRNRTINRRYTTTVKTLLKVFQARIQAYSIELDASLKQILKLEAKAIISKFYSWVDKAVKKNVLHKNNAARKKSSLGLLNYSALQ